MPASYTHNTFTIHNKLTAKSVQWMWLHWLLPQHMSHHWNRFIACRSGGCRPNRKTLTGVTSQSHSQWESPLYPPVVEVLAICSIFPCAAFTTFSLAVSWCMGAAVFCLGWLSLAVLRWVVTCFLARLHLQKYRPYNQKSHHTIVQSSGLFKVLGHDNLLWMSWHFNYGSFLLTFAV